MTRGKEQAQIFTDDKNELLRAVSRPDDPLSATKLAASRQRSRSSAAGCEATGVRPQAGTVRVEGRFHANGNRS